MTSCGCYWNRTAEPYASCAQRGLYLADGAASMNATRDGTRMQYQPFGNQYPLIFQRFMAPENVRMLQRKALDAGFNAPPEERTLREFMNRAYVDDMPYGAYNGLDPLRSIAHLKQRAGDGRGMQYVDYYVDRLNQQVLNRLLRNMAVMRQARRLYQRDISEFRAPMEIDRPISTACKFAGPPVRLDRWLPPAYGQPWSHAAGGSDTRTDLAPLH